MTPTVLIRTPTVPLDAVVKHGLEFQKTSECSTEHSDVLLQHVASVTPHFVGEVEKRNHVAIFDQTFTRHLSKNPSKQLKKLRPCHRSYVRAAFKASVQGRFCAIGLAETKSAESSLAIGEFASRVSVNHLITWRLADKHENHNQGLPNRLSLVPGCQLQDVPEGLRCTWWVREGDTGITRQGMTAGGILRQVLLLSEKLSLGRRYFETRQLLERIQQTIGVGFQSATAIVEKLDAAGLLISSVVPPFACADPVAHVELESPTLAAQLELESLRPIVNCPEHLLLDFEHRARTLNSAIARPIPANRVSVVDTAMELSGSINIQAFRRLNDRVKRHFALLRNAKITCSNSNFRKHLIDHFRSLNLQGASMRLNELSEILRRIEYRSHYNDQPKPADSPVLKSLRTQIRGHYEQLTARSSSYEWSDPLELEADDSWFRHESSLPFEVSARISCDSALAFDNGEFEVVIEMASFPGLLRGRYEWLQLSTGTRPSADTRRAFASFSCESMKTVELCAQRTCVVLNAAVRPCIADFELELYAEKSRYPYDKVLSPGDVTVCFSDSCVPVFRSTRHDCILKFVCTSTVPPRGDVLFDALIALGAPQEQPTATCLPIDPELDGQYGFHPRIVCDGVVVRLANWKYSPERLCQILAPNDVVRAKAVGNTAFNAIRRLMGFQTHQRCNGIPRFLFLTTNDQAKPIPLDTRSPFSLDTLHAAAMHATEWVRLEECFPSPENCWVRDGSGNAHVTEWMFLVE